MKWSILKYLFFIVLVGLSGCVTKYYHDLSIQPERKIYSKLSRNEIEREVQTGDLDIAYRFVLYYYFYNKNKDVHPLIDLFTDRNEDISPILLEKINITTEPEEARLIALIVLDFIEKKPCFFDPRNDILNKLNKIGWGKRTSLIVININEMILPR